jgi:cytochrome c-type biogenesis protein
MIADTGDTVTHVWAPLVALLAGFVSFASPCVLPLVPGYLAALSSVEAGQLGQRGTARRVVVSSLPFILGFTVVFVVLGAGAAAIGTVLSAPARTQVAGFILVVLGLAFVGLLPVPERVLAPGLLSGARRRGSGALLGGAFAVCAAPCIGAVLGSILVLAGSVGSVFRGVVLLVAYSAGIGFAFVLAGLAFTRAMTSFRWVRDRYRVVQIAGGVVLVALGLLLFFGRYWWLNVALNRVLESVGIDRI